MKKHVKKNRNKKGSVLLTVVCFTLVCMIIASTALSLASYSAKNSNNNVRSTQAEISAQNYLQEYINSFPDTGDDTRFNALSTLAGSDANHPNEISAKLKDSAGNDVTSVSTDAKIKVYKSGSGIVVRSEVNSNGETEVASAYFDGTASNPYYSSNVVETYNGATGNDYAMAPEGDVLIEGSSDELYYFHNAQSKSTGDFCCNQNVYASDQTDTTIYDTIDNKPPKMTVSGYLFWQQMYINGTNAKTQGSDGYILTKHAFVMSPLSQKHIGYNKERNPGQKIDIFCNRAETADYAAGAYIGYIPEYRPHKASESPVKNPDYEAVNNISTRNHNKLDGFLSSSQVDDISINGNIYCNGDMYIANGYRKKLTVTGDMYVSGNVYLVDEAKLEVEGTFSCTGNIIALNNIYTYSDSDVYTYSTVPNDKVNATTKTNSSCSINSPSININKQTEIYRDKTPNNIFEGNFRNLKTKYNKAYNNSDISNWSEFVYVDPDNTGKKSLADVCGSDDSNSYFLNTFINGNPDNRTIYIDGDKFKYGFNFNTILDYFDKLKFERETAARKVKFQITMSSDKDFIMILPMNSSHLNFCVDYTNSESRPHDDTTNPYNKVDTPKNFCYFMLDDADYYKLNASNSPVNTPSETWDFKGASILAYSDSSSSYYGTSAFASLATINSFDTRVNPTQKLASNNNIILIPDSAKAYLYEYSEHQELKKLYGNDPVLGDDSKWTNCIQAVCYGPKSELTVGANGNNTRVLLGQAIVDKLDVQKNDLTLSTLLPSPGGVLDIITANSSSDVKLKLQYFIKSKK